MAVGFDSWIVLYPSQTGIPDQIYLPSMNPQYDTKVDWEQNNKDDLYWSICFTSQYSAVRQ